MPRTYFTVYKRYTDDDFQERTFSVWSFKTKAEAIELVNFLNNHRDAMGDEEVYIEEWS